LAVTVCPFQIQSPGQNGEVLAANLVIHQVIGPKNDPNLLNLIRLRKKTVTLDPPQRAAPILM